MNPWRLVAPLTFLLMPVSSLKGDPMPVSSLRERFQNPSACSRILKIIHLPPDSPQDQDNFIASLQAQGFGGVATNVSFQGYVSSEEKWTSFLSWVDKLKKAGLCVWLYDEKGYPSGNADGLTLKDHPEWEAQGVFVSDAVVGPGPMALKCPPGDLVQASAYPVQSGIADLRSGVDLSDKLSEGELKWEAPAGSWHVMILTRGELYEGTHAAVSLADKKPCINLLLPEATKRFLEVTHDEYAKRLGPDLGKWFVATFTDEPSLQSLFMREQPWKVLPWGQNLAPEFKRRRGMDLDPLWPALVAESGPAGQKARYDYWLTIGELVSESYFGQIDDWCRAHGFLSGGHLLLEEPLLTHVLLYGDFFRCARLLSAPSIDCLTSIPEEVPWYVARLLSSAGELGGWTETMSETSDHCQRYRPQGDERPVRVVTEEEIRGTSGKLILNGIMTTTSYYSFADLSQDQLIRINEWIGRCSTLLKGGRQVTDVAFVYPTESLWPRYTPSHLWTKDVSPECQEIERVYREGMESLYGHRWDFTIIDSRTLAEGEVRDGRLCWRNLSWRAVVLPGCDTLPMKAWENLERLWKQGGIVIALSSLPANTDQDFPSAKAQKLGRKLFGKDPGQKCQSRKAGAGVYLPHDAHRDLPKVLSSLLVPPVKVAEEDAPLRVTHRLIDGSHVFFLLNDSRNAWKGQVSLDVKGQGERWDPATGEINPCESPKDIPVELPAFAGLLFRFSP